MPTRPPPDDKSDFQMRLDKSLKIQLQAQAKAEDRSLASLVKQSIRDYLAKHTAITR